MNIRKELLKNNVILLSFSDADYKKGSMGILKNFSGQKAIYVSLAVSFPSIDTKLKKNGINTEKMHFIDVASGKVKDQKGARCYHLSSASALTELSIVIGDLLKEGYTYLVFDSVTNLMIYNNPSRTKKFVIDIVKKMRSAKTKGIYFALRSNVTENIIKAVGAFVDKSIQIKLK
ncbi:hypothetical protein GOV13_01930 [Candidatus Pacearchaeota archaeon]|nr:hypothetical protein [Candidatus Pacearchaeota archaeon]